MKDFECVHTPAMIKTKPFSPSKFPIHMLGCKVFGQ